MTVPSSATYSAAAKVAAHTSFKNLLDTGGAGSVKIRDAADVLLANIPLANPCGTVSGTTGQLTFDVTSARDSSADATGSAAYAEFCDNAGAVQLAIPAQAGSSPASGYFVMNTLDVVTGGPVEIVSATIG